MSDIPTSGAISLNQMHTEVGGTSGTQVSLNDADIRGLISKASGAAMSFNEWYGASSVVWQFSVTAADSDQNTANPQGYDSYCIGKSCSQYDRVGYSTYGDRTAPSNSSADNYGSTTDTTCDFKSGAALKKLNWNANFNPTLTLEIAGTHTNAGFTTMTIGSTTVNRADATFSTQTNTRINQATTRWTWTTADQSSSGGGNPFPYATTYTSLGVAIYTPTGASSTVTFS